jgi:hypothetical protein
MCIALWANYEETPSVALASDVSFAEPNKKQFPGSLLNSKFQQSVIFDHDIYEIFASSTGSLVLALKAKNAAQSHIDHLHTPARTYR